MIFNELSGSFLSLCPSSVTEVTDLWHVVFIHNIVQQGLGGAVCYGSMNDPGMQNEL